MSNNIRHSLVMAEKYSVHGKRLGLCMYRFLHTYRSETVTRAISTCTSRSKLPFTPQNSAFTFLYVPVRYKSSKDNLSSLFIPVPVKVSKNPDDINIGEELSNKLAKDEMLKILNDFAKRPPIQTLSQENGIDKKLFHQAFLSFRRFCMENDNLPVDLHVVLSDILQGAGHVDDLFPYFLQHSKKVFPHLECMEELKKISDLRLPANWYPEARAITRKIIFHSGPTNSGKTYHALERFQSAKSGIYCSPLKLLAAEVYTKTNSNGTKCDLVTGEERRFASEDGSMSSHVASTIEMVSVNTQYEVAIIDEIQMIRDPGRGWAWTRALLGIVAEEVHVCGEEAAIDLVSEILRTLGEELEIRRYKRLTKFTIEDSPLGKLDNIRPGDCIVCFNKNDIYNVSLQLERKGHECAVIYGGLPPGTKLSQAQKFNDPNQSCKIMVATDAIGMGLNLSIGRIIFYSLMRPMVNEKGEVEMDTISTSQALQIAGRAGRFGTNFDHGYVTVFHPADLPVLKDILSRPVESIELAGLHPTADQIELFAYHLPHATLSNLIDIFVSMCEVDTSYHFMCNVDDFKFLAEMIEHIPLPLRARYVFCCAPINRKMPFVCTMFLKFARQYSRNHPVTFSWLCQNIGWPFSTPRTIMDLVHLEAVFDILDLYLWLSYRFQDLFAEAGLVRDMQQELDSIIQQGVLNIINLLKASETKTSSGVAKDENDFVIKSRKAIYKKEKAFTSDDGAERTVIGRGRLTNKLLSEGLLTPKMIQELKKEWLQNYSEDPDKLK